MGDSVYLTALNYRQCAGRAGRRGFDLLGNVVFHNIPEHKVRRLMSSRLPDLNGHFPITTSLVLRLFVLLHDSKHSAYAIRAVDALLSQPRLYMGGDSFKEQTMHHLRFSIEYLRRQHLLGIDGTPLNFAGSVSHLYYTENSSFGFHVLLKEGYLHNLCGKLKGNEKGTLETLMLVMAHLFGRVECRRIDLEYRENVVKPSSSIVFLPELPLEAEQILANHNEETLRVYQSYVQTFVDQHISVADNKLPLTGTQIDHSQETAGNMGALPAAKIRSSFVALSGLGDNFESIHELCSTVRSGVFLEEAVIPYMQVYSKDSKVPLNAWLLDFYKHGSVKVLEQANGIRRSDVWFMLKDFSLVLATIITSLKNYLNITTDDTDILEAQDGFSAQEGLNDSNDASDSGHDKVPGTMKSSSALNADQKLKSKKQTKVADAWDDDDDEGDFSIDSSSSKVTDAFETKVEDAARQFNATGFDDRGGLYNVLDAFLKLQMEFDLKFKAMWA